MILRVIIWLLISSICFAGQGMGPGPGVKGYTAAFTGFTDTFTGTNGAALNSTHWGTISTSLYQILSNRGSKGTSTPDPVQGIESISLQPTTYFKADQSLTLGAVYWILLQNSGNVGGTTTNSIFLIVNYNNECSDTQYTNQGECEAAEETWGPVYYCRLFSYDSGNTGHQHGTSYTCAAGDNLEIRFSSSSTEVSLYKNGASVAGPFTHYATLGSTVQLKWQLNTNANWVDNMEVGVL